MARIDSLKARQRKIHDDYTKALNAYDAATDPAQRKELRTQADGLKAEFDVATADVRAETERLTAEAALGGGAPEHPATAASTKVRDITVPVRVEVGAPRSLEDPKKGFSTPREYMLAVMRFGQGIASPADRERLAPLYQHAAQGSDEQSGTSNPFGGHLIPEAFSPNVLQIEPEGDFTAGRTRVVPMAAKVVPFIARVDKNHSSSVTGGLVVTRKPETVDGSASRIEFEKVNLIASSLYGFAFATEEILMDSAISFAATIGSGFGDEFVNKRISEFVSGTGVGEFEGYLNSPAKVSIAKESGQQADTIVYKNVIKMRARVWGYNRAIWIANHDTMAELMQLSMVVGTGGAPVYVPSIVEDRPDLMLGRPIFYTEYAKTVGDEGDLACVNLFEFLDGLYMPLQSAESIHVRFMANERAYRFWKRDDARCWWRSALTPKNSTATMSPIVTLAARA